MSEPLSPRVSPSAPGRGLAGSLQIPPVPEVPRPQARKLLHFRRPEERPFLAEERASITVLFGGLTATHERLIRAVLQGSGYRAERVPATSLTAYHLGRYFGNTGQCNPAYFTIGALIHYLGQLEAGGLSRSQIIDRYVFLTAGGCGPCRFGMYEAEYRLGLRNFFVLTRYNRSVLYAAAVLDLAQEIINMK